MTSAAKLTEDYFKYMKTEEPNLQWKTKVFKEIQDLLLTGASEKEIFQAIRQDPKNYLKALKRRNKDQNLVQEGVFYYHPHLQVAPPPPLLKQNPETGILEEVYQGDFYLKMRHRFTCEDALDYFYKSFPSIKPNKDRYMGALKYIMEKEFNLVAKRENESHGDSELNGLDLFLYVVDEARALSFDNDAQVRDLMGVKAYMEEGLYLYRERIHYAKLNGLNRIC